MERLSELTAIAWDGLADSPLLGVADDTTSAEARARASLLDSVARAMLTMQRASWEQGVAGQAFLELGDAPMALLFAHEAVLRQDPFGRLANLYSDQNVTDPGANGEVVLFAAQQTGDARLRAGAERMLDYFLRRAPRTADGVFFHMTPSPDGQLWSDSLYMAPPFLALAGHPDEALRQIRGLRSVLWNPARRLFSHMWNDVHRRFERQAFWGVGNGWAAAAMVRTARNLPDSMTLERAELAGYAREVLDGCLAHQRADGLFHFVVDDPSTFVETNLAQMLAYTIYRGVEFGWLDASYRPHADAMRAAVHGKVDAQGLVQGVCGAPFFDKPGTATEGQAFFLLMEAARRDCERARPA